jgi:hypothetical protein
MATAVILFGKDVKGDVKQVTNLSNITINIKSGYVATFTLINATGNGIVKYAHTLEVTNSNGDTTEAGYYEEEQFLNFLANELRPGDLAAYKLDLSRIANALKGDIIKVSKLKIESPYNDFCTLNIYNWAYDPAVPVVDDDKNIIIPTGITPTPFTATLSVTALSFFNHNIGLIISPDFPDNRDEAAYTLAITALEIGRINNDVFPLFSGSGELNNYITLQNTEWATGTIFNQPTYEDFLQYEENIVNYYNTVYSNKVYIAGLPENSKLIWLANVLSTSALAVFPTDLKLTLLQQIIDTDINKYLQEPDDSTSFVLSNGQSIILKLVDAVTDTPAVTDYFLQQLMTVTYPATFGTDKTLFEMLYFYVSDGTIASGTFFNSDNNRKKLIQSLYNIWLISVYYPYYDSPTYTQPANPTGVFPEAYFMTPSGKALYNQTTAPPTLVYQSVSTTLTSYAVNYDYSFIGNKINVTKVVTDRINVEHPSTETTTTQYGIYHLYQPLSIIGFSGPLNIDGLQKNCLPVFVLKYIYDYKNDQNIDFGVMLFVNLALNFTIFGSATELSFLIELSAIAEADTVTAATKVLLWDNVLGVSKTVQFTAGSFSAITHYIAEETDDPDIKAYYNLLSTALGALCIGAVCTEFLAQRQLVNAMQNAYAKAVELGDKVTLDATAKAEIEAIASNLTDIIATMETKLNQVALTSENTLLTKYAALGEDDQLAFHNDFIKMADNDSRWQQLNEVYDTGTERTLVNDWEEVEYLKNYRSEVNFIIANRFIKTNEGLSIHIFEGEINAKGNAVGVHSDIAVTSGKAQIDATLNPPNLDGYSKVEVSIIVNNVAIPKDGFSTFFPDAWTQTRIQEEISLAFTNKIFLGGKKWEGIMSDGNKCRIIILSGNTTTMDATTVIKTAFPNIKF